MNDDAAVWAGWTGALTAGAAGVIGSADLLMRGQQWASFGVLLVSIAVSFELRRLWIAAAICVAVGWTALVMVYGLHLAYLLAVALSLPALAFSWRWRELEANERWKRAGLSGVWAKGQWLAEMGTPRR